MKITMKTCINDRKNTFIFGKIIITMPNIILAFFRAAFFHVSGSSDPNSFPSIQVMFFCGD